MEWFFQTYLGWSIYQSTAFCGGLWIIVYLIMYAIGKGAGWSKGTFLEPYSKNQNETQSAHRDLLSIAALVILIMFVISLCLIIK